MDVWMDDKGEEKSSAISVEDEEKAREERIAVRRARIAAKMAAEEPVVGKVESIASSVELLTGHHKHEQQLQHQQHEAARRKTVTAGAGKTPGTSGSSKQGQPPPPSTAGGVSTGTTSSGYSGQDQLQIQMEQCSKQLQQLLLDGETLITNVKVAAEYRERSRQDGMTKSKKERLAKLRAEAKECEEGYKTIQSQWFEGAKHMLPLELYEKIQQQQMNCDKLLEKKQDLIDDLQSEIESNDVSYENDLDKYQSDMMLLGDRIDDQVDKLRSSFVEELQLIEEFTSRDRELLLEKNQEEWMELLEQFEAMDIKASEDRKNGALERFEKIGDLYINTREEAKRNKRALEDDFRTLQLELEHIKLATIINLEKLEYNLEVLRRRESENLTMKNSMKRYLLKLQDRFNDKVAEYKNVIYKAQRENERLIREIQRLEEINGDARRKILHLLATDYRTFMDLWKFNELEATEKLDKLHGSQKLIYETQFGLKLRDIDLKIFDDRPVEIYHYLQQDARRHRARETCALKRFNVNKGKISEASKKSGAFERGGALSEEDIFGDASGGQVKIHDEFSSENMIATDDEDEAGGDGAGTGVDDESSDDDAGNEEHGGKEHSDDEFTIHEHELDSEHGKHGHGGPGLGGGHHHRHHGHHGGHGHKHHRGFGLGDGKPSLFLEQTDSNEFLPGPEPDPEVQRKLMKHLAKVVCDQTGFIIEEKLRKILAPMIETEKTLVHIDAVLQALGVKTIPEMQLMARYLLRRAHVVEGIVSKGGTAQTAASSMNVSGQEAPPSPHLGLQSYDAILETLIDKNDLVDVDLKDEELKEMEAAEEESMIMNAIEEDELGKKSRNYEDYVEFGGERDEDQDSQFDQSINLDDFVLKSTESMASIDVHDAPSVQLSVLSEISIEHHGRTGSVMFADEVNKPTGPETSSGSAHSIHTAGSTDTIEKLKESGEDEDEEGEEEEEEEESEGENEGGEADKDKPSKPKRSKSKGQPTGQQKPTTTAIKETYSSLTSARTDQATIFSLDKNKSSLEIVTIPLKRKSTIAGEEGEVAEVEGETVEDESPPSSETSYFDKCPDDDYMEDTSGKHRKAFMEAIPTATRLLDDVSTVIESSETVSIPSLPTTAILTEEFLYIEPNDVLRALAEFCKDFNAKIKIELPTEDEIIDAKLVKLTFPNKGDITEYWNRFLLLLEPKPINWNVILDVFGQYNKLLKTRNQYVEDVSSLFQENMELSHLLKKHMEGGGKSCFGAQFAQSNTNLPYC